MSLKTTKEQAEDWLKSNASHIKLIKWGGKASVKSKFVDLNRDIEFWYKFGNLKSSLKKCPNKIFNCTKEEWKNAVKKNCLQKYGVENVSQIKKVQEKRSQTFLKKYDGNPLKNKQTRNKIKQTNLKKYGHENPFGNKDIQNKIKQTNLKKYGNICSAQGKEIQKEIRQTNLKKYGGNPLSNKNVQEKIKQTNLKKYGVKVPAQNKEIQNKIKQTNLKKYGCENPFGNKDIQNKIKQTNLKKYGAEWTLQNKNIREKAKQTKIKKGLTTVVDGKTIPEWAINKNLASEMSLYTAYKNGIHPLETKPRQSILELKIKQFLDENNINYIYNKVLPEHKGMKQGYKRPDFLLLKYNLIIECDGEHYHQDKEKDVERNKLYKNLGYKVLCFSGQDISNNWEKVEEKILNTITI